MSLERLSAAGREALARIHSDPGGTLLATDFDGTIAPIVDDPEQAVADPAAVAALAACARLGMQVAVVTGRPARTVVRLGGFRDHADLATMVVLGQYGVERWDAASDTFALPEPPAAIANFAARLPRLLADIGHPDLHIEDKGRAVAVHTRRAADPHGAFAAITPPVTRLAQELGLQPEPGRLVLEVRTPGVDKGDAIRSLVTEFGSRQVVFCGDDLGDLAAFEGVRSLRGEGVAGLLVASGSAEQQALTELADVVVDGVAGVAGLLTELART